LDAFELPHIKKLKELTPEKILKISETWGDGSRNYIEVQI